MLDKRRSYMIALCIETGDLVRTSYNTGPYEVWSMTPPLYVKYTIGAIIVRSWPVISLLCVPPGQKPNGDRYAVINEVRQEGDHWFTDVNDEVFVTKPAERPVLPVDMFASYPPLP